MTDDYYGITYCDRHIYRILRAGNVKGGGSIISEKEFDESILGKVYLRTVVGFYELLPDGRLTELTTKDKLMPKELVDMSWEIQKYLNKHGPFSPMAIGLMVCIIDMDFMGITDCDAYFQLKEYFDENPAVDFKDYVEKVTKFEKELE